MPYIARSACKHGISFYDVQAVLRDPLESLQMSDLTPSQPGDHLTELDRVNVVVHAGYGIYGQKLVVFVDRFEDMAFHAEPGERNFGWMFK